MLAPSSAIYKQLAGLQWHLGYYAFIISGSTLLQLYSFAALVNCLVIIDGIIKKLVTAAAVTSRFIYFASYK